MGGRGTDKGQLTRVDGYPAQVMTCKGVVGTATDVTGLTNCVKSLM